MNHLTMKSTDLTQVNIGKIAELFPNVITEARDEQGIIKRAVDFDLLKQELSDYLVEGEKERYQMTWPGKREAILHANTAIDKTLRPVKDDSVNWENTQNLYIEGDNLEVLKLLQESYLNKIKCIYIDPPYNTGKDFIYKDDFSTPIDEYFEESGQVDQEGNRLYQNTESNGRFHSDWLSMMYSRLRICRNLLKEDGLIFISIDNNEIENLMKIGNEVFGEQNFVTCVANINNPKGRSDDRYFATAHEYIVIYKKSEAEIRGFVPEDNVLRRYNKVDEQGIKYREIDLRKTGDSDRKEDRPNMFYYFIYNQENGDFYPTYEEEIPEGCIQIVPTRDDKSLGRWRWGIETAREKINKLIPKFMKVKEKWTVMEKDYLSDKEFVKPTTNWDYKDVNSERGTEQFIELGFDKRIFDRPKPIGTIQRILEISTKSEDIILDFFSGSATTAQAVMRLNAEDGGNRRFILAQIPDSTDENSVAYSLGYKTICDIGKERIRRAANKIKEDTGANIDYGFRVYRVDSSNMKDVYYTPDKLGQMNLDDLASNIKEDRTGEDLLIQVMLEFGLELSLPMESKEIEGKTVHYVAGNSLIACFDDEVSETVIKKIAEDQPLRVVFRDSSFRDDSARINVEELFKLLSPSTEIQVL